MVMIGNYKYIHGLPDCIIIPANPNHTIDIDLLLRAERVPEEIGKLKLLNIVLCPMCLLALGVNPSKIYKEEWLDFYVL